MLEKASYHEQELLRKISEGDEAAFATFFYHYIGILKPFVFSFTKSEAVAEELVQDIFIRVWLARDKLPELTVPKAWLFKVASNECFRYLRKQLIETKTATQATSNYNEAVNATYDYINVQEIKKLVTEVVNNLAPQRRRIYQLSREQGLKIEEIALELQLSANTVKNVLVTSAKLVREHLERAGYYLPLFLVLLLIK